jgi:hypothetical protein
MLDIFHQPLNSLEIIILVVCTLTGGLGFMIGLMLSVAENIPKYRTILAYCVLVFVFMLVLLSIVREIRIVHALFHRTSLT